MRPLPPTLESLPDLAQSVLASFLPQSSKEAHRQHRAWKVPIEPTRLSLSLVSRAMLGFHGGTLTTLVLRRWDPGYRVEALARLVARQHALTTVDVCDPLAIPAVSTILKRGGLGHLTELVLELDFDKPTTTLVHVQNLAAALRAPGALEKVEILRLLTRPSWKPGMLPVLASALASAAAPLLRVLDLNAHSPKGTFNDEDMEALSAMVEARARLGCRPLDKIKAHDLFDGPQTVDIQDRLMVALLPSLIRFTMPMWDNDYEETFVALRPARLKKCTVVCPEMPSVPVWEAMPNMANLNYVSYDTEFGELDDMEPLISAFVGGVAFRQLTKLCFHGMKQSAIDWVRLFAVVGRAPCAAHLTHLNLTRSNCN